MGPTQESNTPNHCKSRAPLRYCCRASRKLRLAFSFCYYFPFSDIKFYHNIAHSLDNFNGRSLINTGHLTNPQPTTGAGRSTPTHTHSTRTPDAPPNPQKIIAIWPHRTSDIGNRVISACHVAEKKPQDQAGLHTMGSRHKNKKLSKGSLPGELEPCVAGSLSLIKLAPKLALYISKSPDIGPVKLTPGYVARCPLIESPGVL